MQGSRGRDGRVDKVLYQIGCQRGGDVVDEDEGREEEDGRGLLRAGCALVVLVRNGDVGGGEFEFLRVMSTENLSKTYLIDRSLSRLSR